MSWHTVLGAHFRKTLADLLGEGGAEALAGSAAETPFGAAALRAEAEARRALLEVEGEQAAAAARARRAERDWRAAQSEVERLEAAIDAALVSRQETAARRLAHEAQVERERAERLASHHAACAAVESGLAGLAAELKGALEMWGRHTTQMGDREDNARAFERWERLRRELRRVTAQAETSLATRSGQLARREDRLAALDEIRRRGKE